MSRVRIIDLEPKVIMRGTLFRDMVRGLLLLVVVPLRLITGRRRPDYARIAALELELGMREPVNVIEKLSGISCPVKPVQHEPLVLGQSWEFIPLPHQPVSSGYAKPKRQDDYERGQEIGEDILAHLGHDHEQIDVTAIGDREPKFIRGRCLTGQQPMTLENLKAARRMTWEQLRDLTRKLTLSGGRGLTADERSTWDSLQRQLDHFDQVITTLLRQQHD